MVIAWGKFQKVLKEEREKQRLMEIEKFVRLWFQELGDEQREALVKHFEDGGTYLDWSSRPTQGNGTH